MDRLLRRYKKEAVVSMFDSLLFADVSVRREIADTFRNRSCMALDPVSIRETLLGLSTW